MSSSISSLWVIIFVAGFIIGAIVAWLMTKNRSSLLLEAARTTLNGEIGGLTRQLSEKTEEVAKTQAEISKLENNLAELTGAGHELRKELALAARETKELRGAGEELKKAKQFAAEQQARIAVLETRLEETRRNNAEKLQLIESAKEKLTDRFKTLAQEILEEKGRIFADHSESRLNSLLTPFREQIQQFHSRVNEVHESQTKDQASLRQTLDSLRQANKILNQEAVNLTRALKGDNKIQGNWGEMILEKVLEQSGLRKGQEYEVQNGVRDNDNKLLRPDVIVRLPEGREVVIDAKVSLVAYEKFCSEENENDRNKALTAHIQAVRNHIRLLSSKNYADLPTLKTPDFVLMFMPIEPAFMVAMQKDEKMFSQAFAKRIIVVTPTTLLATLRTIDNIWRFERQNRNTMAIAEMAGRVYDKLRGFVDDMDRLDRQLTATRTTFDRAMDKLTTGRGNLVNQAEKFVELGVKVKKEITQSEV